MSRVSVIIPARNERYLDKVVNDILEKATGDIEIIVVFDGPTKYPLLREDPRIVMIDKPKAEGLRPALNDAASIATGEYIIKMDAHCMVGEGFDEILQRDCEDDWVVVPRRYNMDWKTWERRDNTRIDYFYLSFPWTDPHGFVMNSIAWVGKSRAGNNILIDDTMTFHGSFWFMPIDYFHNRLHGLSTDGYGSFVGEQIEIGMKTWMGGGQVKVNKNTWYAHITHGWSNRDYDLDWTEHNRGLDWAAHYWTENKWEDRLHDYDWLVDKFWPLPTINCHTWRDRFPWPENWRDYYDGTL